jgi:hypothetical protein
MLAHSMLQEADDGSRCHSELNRLMFSLYQVENHTKRQSTGAAAPTATYYYYDCAILL